MYGGQPFRSKREQWKLAGSRGPADGSGREHVPDSFSKDLKFASTVPAGRLEPCRKAGTEAERRYLHPIGLDHIL